MPLLVARSISLEAKKSSMFNQWNPWINANPNTAYGGVGTPGYGYNGINDGCYGNCFGGYPGTGFGQNFVGTPGFGVNTFGGYGFNPYTNIGVGAFGPNTTPFGYGWNPFIGGVGYGVNPFVSGVGYGVGPVANGYGFGINPGVNGIGYGVSGYGVNPFGIPVFQGVPVFGWNGFGVPTNWGTGVWNGNSVNGNVTHNGFGGNFTTTGPNTGVGPERRAA